MRFLRAASAWSTLARVKRGGLAPETVSPAGLVIHWPALCADPFWRAGWTYPCACRKARACSASRRRRARTAKNGGASDGPQNRASHKTDGTVLSSLRIARKRWEGRGWRKWDEYARVGGDGGAGFWVCAANAAAEPGVCGGGGADFGVGDRGEHGDFYSARPGFVAAAAGEKSAAVGAADHAREALREQLGRQRDFLSDVSRFPGPQ